MPKSVRTGPNGNLALQQVSQVLQERRAITKRSPGVAQLEKLKSIATIRRGQKLMGAGQPGFDGENVRPNHE